MSAITVKGQVTIPKHWRDRFGLQPGVDVDFRESADGLLAIVPTVSRDDAFREALRRARGTATAGLTTEEIMSITRACE